ncbi:hypothetical protein B0H17DRAFT_1157730 [Mycena rosella]|uniref:Thioester reductase (TE) domain-containing protein n=1 Tax=Mycena rosella TaxID=1033263 RepID=A0AAD7DWK8_MYCRO|nr:hypothetical protein B0H17DRAFT_1157730 [Mycena rosella]
MNPSTLKTIPNVVAHNSDANPTGPFYIYYDPTSSEIVTITNLEFARAVARAAHILRPHLSASDGEVVAVLALSDTILYHAIIVGLLTANLTVSFVLDIEEVPSLAQIYPNLGTETLDCPFEPYMQPTDFPALDSVCLYLHSSGSTGLPKAIPHTHRILMQQASFLIGNPVVVYPPSAISSDSLPIMPTPSNILEHARKTNCVSLMAIPALFSIWAASPEAMAYLKTLRIVLWSGGALPYQLGSFLHGSGVNMRGMYGATETGPLSRITLPEGDEQEWEWLRFADQVKIRWVPQGDETFECQLMTWENHTLLVENLHDVKGYATSDLFVNHPEKKYLIGRIDDVIVHTSGEKTVPAPMEDILLGSPYVSGAVMFGRNREQAGILIEPTCKLAIDVENAKQFAELRNKIWPIVEEANNIAPAFSRIFKEMIIFASVAKPLPRAGKGTVQRKPAVDLYSREIDAVYVWLISSPGYNVVAENTNLIDSIEPPTVWQATLIKVWLVELAKDLCNSVEISSTVDLFQQGFDSLSATVFRIRIISALRSSAETNIRRASAGVTQNFVYSHPTISKLSMHLEQLVNGTMKDAESPDVVMSEMIAKHASGFAQPIASPPSTGHPTVILLTGSTGNLGSHILASLLQNETVSKPSATRPCSGIGLDTGLLASLKLVCVEGRINQKDLGLNLNLYNEIRTSVTVIIHNAWQLDFNLTLDSFEPHILGTRHLADFALSSPLSPKFVFISSIAAMSADPAVGPSPKEMMYVAAGAFGYGQSKFVAEQILMQSGLHTASLRIGQLYGGLPNGAWATTDWIPILVKSSKTLGCLPLVDGLVSWLDFETTAQAVLDVAFHKVDSEDLFSVFTVVNPRPVSWNFIMESICEAIRKQCSMELQLVPFLQWYAALESVASGHNYSKADDMIHSQPGIKLLDIFSRLSNVSVGSPHAQREESTFSTEKIQALSDAMRSVDAVTSDVAEAWVKYWRSSGFL